MKKLFLAVAVMAAGCTSMPIGTMIRMASFDAEDYLSINAADLRMRLTTDAESALVSEETSLVMNLVLKDGRETVLGGTLVMESAETLPEERGILSFGFNPRHRYVLKLDDEGIRSFERMQALLREKKLRTLGLKAEYDFEERRPAKVTVEMMFLESEGYFTLLEKMDFPPEQAAGAAAAQ